MQSRPLRVERCSSRIFEHATTQKSQLYVRRAQAWLHKKQHISHIRLNAIPPIGVLAHSPKSSPARSPEVISVCWANIHEATPTNRRTPPEEETISARDIIHNEHIPCSSSQHICHIAKLPIELLENVFTSCLPDDLYIVLNKTSAPVLLSQICGYWRQIVLSMPHLWSSMSIGGPADIGPCPSLTNLWLDRSRTSLLSVRLARPLSNNNINMYGSFWQIMVHHQRWKNVSFDLNNDLASAFLTLSFTNMTSLDSVRLDLRDCSSENSVQVAQAINCIPDLRRLAWQKSFDSSLFFVNWSRLTHVYLRTCVSSNECLEILDRCSNVVEFRVHYIASSPMFPHTESIILPHLQSLELISSCDVGPLMDCLTIPSLVSFAIHHAVPPAPRNCQSLEHFLTRSNCQLQSFALRDQTLSEENLIRHLRLPQLQSLCNLVIRSHLMSNRIESAQLVKTLLPHLESMVFEHSSLTVDNDAVRCIPWGPLI